jgi:peptide chain release factor subunit 1
MVEEGPLLDWITENYTNFGATVELITSQSQVGAQFCRGLGGLGAFLRYRLERATCADAEHDNDSEDYEFDFY